jgi:hypothetical protein
MTLQRSIERKQRRWVLDAIDIQCLYELLDNGESYRFIAQQLDIHFTAVGYWKRKRDRMRKEHPVCVVDISRCPTLIEAFQS